MATTMPKPRAKIADGPLGLTSTNPTIKGCSMGDKGSKDKGKRETQKKAQKTPKEKRKEKKEKKRKDKTIPS